MSSVEAQPLVAMRLERQDEARIDQRVAIYPDGRAWYWPLASVDPASAFRVGTFAVQLGAAELEQATAAARQLPHAESAWTDSGADAPQVTLTAGSYAVSFPRGADIDPRLFAVYSLMARTMAEASAAPLSALELTVRLQPGQVAFLFQALGAERVRFLLDRDSFSLGGDGWSYQPDDLRGVGLIAEGGRHVDGIHAPAALDPGEKAALVLRNLPPFTQPGPVRLVARVAGTIVLVGPEAVASADGEPFLLSRLVEGGIAPA